MKKSLLVWLFFTAILNAQIVTIPDANFKNKLIALGIDSNADGNIQHTEALAVTSLNVSDSSIASLQGIESFTNLTYLNCFNNHYISSLNLSTLTNLTFLDCSRNNLTSLNVSMLTNLTTLKCYTNNLYSLDITALTNLTYLDCAENHIPALNVESLTTLTHLNCTSNNISVLNVTNLTNLTVLYCGGNSISVLDVGALVNLEQLHCNNNNINNLSLTALTQLDFLFCNSNPIVALNLSTLTNLTRLNCGSPQLLNLDLSANVNLTGLGIYGGQFTNVDLSHLVNLGALTVWDSAMTSLDISNSPALWELRLVSTNNLHYLNLKNGGTINPMYLSSADNIMNICCNEGDLARVNLQMSFTNTALLYTANSNCLFFPMGDYNTITGNVRYDSDGNGCTAGDVFQSGVRVKIASGANQGMTMTNQSGSYEFFPQTGTFIVTPETETPSYFTFTPANAVVTFDNNNGNVSAQYFCMSNNGVHNDLEVVFVPLTTARPGFDSRYKVIYKNKGNQTLNGSVELIFEDDVLDFVNATYQPASLDVGHMTWNYENLLPLETRSFIIVFNVNSPVETPPVNIGDQLDFGLSILPVVGDEIPTDNEFGLKQTVVGSYDPNDKVCLEGAIVSPTRIGEYLHYVVNFENTGTFAAERVVVKDVIDATQFNLSTLRILESSHEMITRVTGNVVEFIFEGIDLVPNQHGNVVFKIKSKASLNTGATVANKAKIYFDYNAPIETNTASTTYQALELNETEVNNNIVLYPNPTKDNITVSSNSNIISIQLLDVQGRILEAKSIEGSQEAMIEMLAYRNGIYFLKVTSEFGNKVLRFVKE